MSDIDVFKLALAQALQLRQQGPVEQRINGSASNEYRVRENTHYFPPKVYPFDMFDQMGASNTVASNNAAAARSKSSSFDALLFQHRNQLLDKFSSNPFSSLNPKSECASPSPESPGSTMSAASCFSDQTEPTPNSLPLNIAQQQQQQQQQQQFIKPETAKWNSLETAASLISPSSFYHPSSRDCHAPPFSAAICSSQHPRSPVVSLCGSNVVTNVVARGGKKRSSAQCIFPGCDKLARGASLCKKHGGGRRCNVARCTNSARGGSQRCTQHGGGRRCQSPGCTKGAEGATFFCVSHGGGRRCTHEGCDKKDQGGGKCKRHGGGKRCSRASCGKSVKAGHQVCAFHAKQGWKH